MTQVQISLILHFIPADTTDFPCGFAQALINLSFSSVSFEIRVALGKISRVLWLFNSVDTGRVCTRS